MTTVAALISTPLTEFGLGRTQTPFKALTRNLLASAAAFSAKGAYAHQTSQFQPAANRGITPCQGNGETLAIEVLLSHATLADGKTGSFRLWGVAEHRGYNDQLVDWRGVYMGEWSCVGGLAVPSADQHLVDLQGTTPVLGWAESFTTVEDLTPAPQSESVFAVTDGCAELWVPAGPWTRFIVETQVGTAAGMQVHTRRF